MPEGDGKDVQSLRLEAQVAQLYYGHDMRQVEIAERLRLSQSRVSRLLASARKAGIVRTTVVLPPELNLELSETIARRYSLRQVHVVDATARGGEELAAELGQFLAAILQFAPPEVTTVGFTSWSRALRAMVGALKPLEKGADRVVEMLGDVGPPSLQHEAAACTQRLAEVLSAEARFLRVPGVVATPRSKDAYLAQNSHALKTLEQLDEIDLALAGVGACEVAAPLEAGDNFFTEEQFAHARAQGAVGEVNLHFIDAEGRQVATEFDELLIGASVEQLRSAGEVLAVAGGPDKFAAILGAVRSGWIQSLVTDLETAERLVRAPAIS
jgi:DNA-binding transcriptional regulator LsrR (DeoR family)